VSAPKFDAGKLPLSLVPTDMLRAVARVLAFGAKKYKAWSWTAGKDWSRDYDAAMRHMVDWHDGIDLDPESGEPHLAHALCDLSFLLVSTLRGLGKDDRPIYGQASAVKKFEDSFGLGEGK
jgi:hypothetical protein